MMIYTEITPNPASLKFVTERVLMPSGTADYPTPDSAAESALAQKLFEFAFVEGVFLGHNFVTVTKSSDKEWESIIPQLKETIKQFLASGTKVIDRDFEEAPVRDENETETVTRIKKLLDENIRPAVATDGGDVTFEGFEDGVVKLMLRGSCSGCPSSTMTLKMGIEGLLTRMVPEVKEVVAVNG